MTYGRNDEAIAAIQKGIDKGGLKDTADAETTLGIALFNAGKKMEAVAVFDNAAMANSPSAAVAHIWSQYFVLAPATAGKAKALQRAMADLR